MDPGDLTTEKIASFTKLFDFFYPEADFPIRTFEKELLRFWIHYEAVGGAKWRVEGFNRRGQPIASQDVIIPDITDKSVRIATFDLAISDDVIKTVWTCLCGPASIIYCICDFVPGGQARKES